MKSHSHTALCDKEWFFYHEAIDFDIDGSANRYLNMVFDIFDADGIPRSAIERVIAQRIDENSPNPVYFLYDDIVYVWFICDSCKMSSLN